MGQETVVTYVFGFFASCLVKDIQLRSGVLTLLCSEPFSSSGQLMQPFPWVQGTGFSDGCDQVLVISIAPAPPADLGLAAAGNGSSVA